MDTREKHAGTGVLLEDLNGMTAGLRPTLPAAGGLPLVGG